MKKMKKGKILAAALAMMTFSTAAAVTGTVAWFTASNVVEATGMFVQADKEEGIVMANETYQESSNWATSVKASHDGKVDNTQAKFIPTSTIDSIKWAHASASNQGNKEAINDSYSMITPEVITGTGVYKASINGSPKNIYLLNTFYLKSASTEKVSGDLWAKVTATANHNDDLNKTLRVLVKHNSDALIFAPIDGATMGYQVCTAVTPAIQDNSSTPENEYVAANVTKENATAYNTAQKLSTAIEIPANNPSAPGINTFPVNVFIYFEGEDAACYSDNITTTLDQLSIVVKLGLTENL